MPDSQSIEPAFESPFATILNLGHFRSLHDAPVHSAVNHGYLAIDSGGNESEQSLREIAAWLESFPEKSSWCRNEQVCQGVKCNVWTG